ncbi:MAG TPA: hypothetical protein PKI78_10980, partial [Anaerolineales bacterium]|nr:hypothetical protein [Anaerolineales bacterium]
IVIGTVSGNSFTGCTRGYSTTDAAAHSAGTQVLEKQTTCVYIFADHPVKTIDALVAHFG